MGRRLGFLVGLGAGYVLGTKAGRERYEQLRRLYDNLVGSPLAREAGGRARTVVGKGVGGARNTVTSAVSRDRRSDPGNLSVAPPPG